MEQTLTVRESIHQTLGPLDDLPGMQRAIDGLTADGTDSREIKAYFDDRAARFEVKNGRVGLRAAKDVEDKHSHKKKGTPKFWDGLNTGRNKAGAIMWRQVSAGTPFRVWLWFDLRASGQKSLRITFTHKHLAEKMNVSRWAVQDAVKTLTGLGIIRIERKGTVRRDGDGVPTVITLYPDEFTKP
jgi:hypothetical protein